MITHTNHTFDNKLVIFRKCKVKDLEIGEIFNPNGDYYLIISLNNDMFIHKQLSNPAIPTGNIVCLNITTSTIAHIDGEIDLDKVYKLKLPIALVRV